MTNLTSLKNGQFVSLEEAGEIIHNQNVRIQELLEHNTQLMERSRKAEHERDDLREALLAAAKMGGKIAQELQREIDRGT